MEIRSTTPSVERTGILWLVLDARSQTELRQTLPPRYNTDVDGHQLFHHATLLFGVSADSPEVREYAGTEIAIEAYAHAYDSNVEAVRIRPVEGNGLPNTTYGVPHITLSLHEGIKPFQSVAMLQAEDGSRVEKLLAEPILLQGTVEFYSRQR